MDISNLEEIIWYRLLIGYLYANLFGSIFIWMVMKQMRKMIGFEPPEKLAWQPHITGIMERTLYLISLLVKMPEFIAVWLAYKVAIGWKVWEGDIKKKEKELDYDYHKGRAIFSNHFNGSALSILYAFIGYLIIVLWSFKAVIYSIIFIFLTVALVFILIIYKEYTDKKECKKC